MTARPRVLLDVDGVLADICVPTFAAVHAAGGPLHRMEDMVEWDMYETVGTEFRELCLETWMTEGFCAAIPPFAGAADGVRHLREVAEVYFVTSPFYGARHWMWERLCWLKEHMGATEDEVVYTHKKQIVVGDFLVEDRPKNILSWAPTHPDSTVVIWDQPYTRTMIDPPNSVRTRAWDTLCDLVGSWRPPTA